MPAEPKVTVVYTIMAYAPCVPDDKRTWHGNNVEESERVLREMRERYPTATIRYDVSTYIEP